MDGDGAISPSRYNLPGPSPSCKLTTLMISYATLVALATLNRNFVNVLPLFNLLIQYWIYCACHRDRPIPPVGRRRALLISCCYKKSPHKSMRLKNSCKDVFILRDVLYRLGWQKDEIVILAECDEHGHGHDFEGNKPTWKEIRKQHRLLVRDAKSGDFLFLHMSGHGSQQRAIVDLSEADGMDEYFIPCDYFRYMKKKNINRYERTWRLGTRKAKILDNDMRETIVNPLPAGAKLVALIDCCSGGTLLDLPIECRTMKLKTLLQLFKKMTHAAKRTMNYAAKNIIPHRDLRQCILHSFFQPRMSLPIILPLSANMGHRASRKAYNHGRTIIQGSVMSISACHDGKQTFETNEGGSLVTMFAHILNQTDGTPIPIGDLRYKLEVGLRERHDLAKKRFEMEGKAWNSAWTAPVPQFCFSQKPKWNEYFSLSN